MSNMNRLATCKNQYQGDAKRVLCVCSAGLLRSPTAAVVLAGEPYNFNTRAAGITEDFALIYADDTLLTWADEIVCMQEWQKEILIERLGALDLCTVVKTLGIPDDFRYRDPELVRLITVRYPVAEEETAF